MGKDQGRVLRHSLDVSGSTDCASQGMLWEEKLFFSLNKQTKPLNTFPQSSPASWLPTDANIWKRSESTVGNSKPRTLTLRTNPHCYFPSHASLPQEYQHGQNIKCSQKAVMGVDNMTISSQLLLYHKGGGCSAEEVPQRISFVDTCA